MTVDFLVPSETAALIEPGKPTFYPVRIDLQHRQLKHRISTRISDVIYYCSSHEIYALHLKTRKRELVKTLAWAPQCLDAGYGWICAGGPDKARGQCAFIRIANDQSPGWNAGRYQAEVDDLLPLDPDPESRSLTQDNPSWPRQSTYHSQKYVLHYYELGSEIVNSVRLHLMKGGVEGVEDEVVVVSTNNDKTVRIFSLTQFKLLASLHYPTPMNHASISPDSDLLLAVGDEPRAFFHRRILFESPLISGEKTFATYSWQSFAEPRLHQTPSTDACFSTSFSPTGQVCAVASQGGVITVYDLTHASEELNAENAVICTLKTSRSSPWSEACGAVRSLEFSPPPWDLLVWAEDQGQVSVIDLRDPPVSKQTLDLKTQPSAVVLAELDEQNDTIEQRRLEIERRFMESSRAALDAQDRLAGATTDTTDYNEHIGSRTSRNSDPAIMVTQRDAQDQWTERERRTIDSIGVRRPRPVENESRDSTIQSIPAQFVPSLLTREANAPYSSEFPTSSSHAGTAFPHNIPSHMRESFAEYLRQQNDERLRALGMPRRRTSVLMSNSAQHDEDADETLNPVQSSASSNLTPGSSAAITLSSSPSRLSSSSGSGLDTAVPGISGVATAPTSQATVSAGSVDPWQTITDAFTSTYTDPPPSNAPNRNRRDPPIGRMPPDAQAQNVSSSVYGRLREQIGVRASPRLQHLMLRHERERNSNVQRLRQLQNAMAVQGRELPTALYEVLEGEMQNLAAGQSRDGGLFVMGVGWSADGRSLFVGTEDGILEYSVNVRQRMQWPGISFL